MTERTSLAKIPDDFNYYEHQIDGVRQMLKMSSVLLADDMGLGKSIQALTVAAVDFERGRAKRVLIVCPATLKANWYEEIGVNTLFTSVVLNGTPKQRNEQIDGFDQDILIVNYEQLQAHIDQINAMAFNICIFDEAHYMKNPKARRTKACMAVRADRFLLLTGSPMLNHVNDLWALLHRIDPVAWPKYWAFRNRYCLFGGYMDKEVVGVKNQAELSEKLKALMIRRKKSDVLDLPDKQYVKVSVDLTPEQKKLYDQARDEMMIDMPDGANPMELENGLVKFLRLKQICGTTATIPGHADSSNKLDRVVEMIEEFTEAGEPVVVFTQFRGVLEALNHRLGGRCHQLHGDVPASQRVPTVQRWTAEAKAGRPGPILCMLQVAGVGLNMTTASKMIFVDKLFVPKLNEQAEDRCHRIGADLTRPVQIFEMITRNTIESRVEEILRRKSKTFSEVVEDSDFKRKLYAELMKEKL